MLKIKKERGSITTNLTKKKKRRDYKAVLWKFYANKTDNLDEPGKVLERHKSMKLTQEEEEEKI